MFLTNREQEKLMIYTAAKLAEERKQRGLKLNYPESVALISSYVMEGARDGKNISELIVGAKKLLSTDDVLDGIEPMLGMVQIEATFEDGTKLVTVHHPVKSKTRNVVAGEYLFDDDEISFNTNKEIIKVQVQNCGDRPIQISSHYHFFEVNSALDFPRELSYGMRLNILSGTSVRFEPGSLKEVELIPYTGKRYVKGFAGLVQGPLDDSKTKNNAFVNLKNHLGDA
jgi:urease subunit gamma/beta